MGRPRSTQRKGSVWRGCICSDKTSWSFPTFTPHSGTLPLAYSQDHTPLTGPHPTHRITPPITGPRPTDRTTPHLQGHSPLTGSRPTHRTTPPITRPRPTDRTTPHSQGHAPITGPHQAWRGIRVCMIQYLTSKLATWTFKPGSFGLGCPIALGFQVQLLESGLEGDTDVLPEVCITATAPHCPHGLEKPHPTSN